MNSISHSAENVRLCIQQRCRLLVDRTRFSCTLHRSSIVTYLGFYTCTHCQINERRMQHIVHVHLHSKTICFAYFQSFNLFKFINTSLSACYQVSFDTFSTLIHRFKLYKKYSQILVIVVKKLLTSL